MADIDLLETQASYVPALVVRRLVENPAPLTEPMEDRFPAAMLFADLSGFTLLAEHLAQQGPEGAEELSDFLNRKFDQLITLITSLGGDVVTFAGDALLALWSTDRDHLALATLRAAQCSLNLQAMVRGERLSAPIHLDVRIGIAIGDVGIIHVGGVYERWMWLVTGKPVMQLMQIERQADPGQIVLSPEAWELIQHGCQGTPIMPSPMTSTTNGNAPPAPTGVLLESILTSPPPACPLPLHLNSSMDSALCAYIPDVVLTRLAAGQGNWLAELRMITVLFINLPDIQDSYLSLNEIQHGIRTIQIALYRYEGSVNKLSLDEKGAILIAVFGLPPLAHEDDAIRGVQAAMAVLKAMQEVAIRCSIGVTTGRAFCGILGNDQRREYTILGDIVNLAARLMQATSNAILCDAATYQAAQPRIIFDEHAPIAVKGKAEPVVNYQPLGLAEHVIPPQDAIIGRVEEQAMLASLLQELRRRKATLSRHGNASVLILEGEAGIGKSRLIHSMREHAAALRILTLYGEGDAVELSTPYYAWRRVFLQLLDMERVTDLEERRKRVLNFFAAEPDLLDKVPLLNAVIPLDMPESSYTNSLSGQALAEATRSFFLNLFYMLLSRIPTLIIIEDVQWIDSASWTLLLAVSQHIPSLLVTITTRPLGESPPDPYTRLVYAPDTHAMRLEPMSREDAYALVCQRLGVARAPNSVTDLIYERAQGNPFFIEELTYALRDMGDIIIRDGVCWVAPEAGDLQALSLPDTAHGVITSRIDRITPSQQLTLKVASVIGYMFDLQILHDVYPVVEEKPQLDEHLAVLERMELLQHDEMDAIPCYRFKNAITHEVVYHLIPFAQRRQLHRAVAEWYINDSPDRLEELASLLAKHFDQADDPRAQKYYTLAGNEAYRLYANTEAIAHFSRALAIAHQHQARNEHFIYLYSRCGRILEVQSEYEQALANYEQMEALAEEREDQEMKLTALMALATLRSTPNPTFDPQQGEILLEQALTLSRKLDDRIAESKILWNLMLLKTFTSEDSHQAVSYGEQSLALARSFNLREQVAFTLNDLSMAYRNSGQLERSQAVLEEACIMWRNLDNLPMLSENLSHYAAGHFLAGNYNQAIACSEEAARISESIDNGSGLAHSRLIVGNVYLEWGQFDKAIEVMSEAIFQGEHVGQLTVQVGTRADFAWVYGILGEIDHGIVMAEVAWARSEEHNNILRSWAMAVLARLLILKGDLAEAERAIRESYQTYKDRNEMLLAPIYVPLADAELALANFDYERVIEVTDRLLAYLQDYQIRPFRADAFYIKSQALLGLGKLPEARRTLHLAQQDAQSLGSSRMLWQILFLLSHMEACAGNLEEAGELLHQARDIVLALADSIGDEELRESFLHQPHVRVVAGMGRITPPTP